MHMAYILLVNLIFINKNELIILLYIIVCSI